MLKHFGNKPLSPDGLALREIIRAELYRGKPEGGGFEDPIDLGVEDLITTNGRIYLAQRIGANVNSPMAYMVVGTVATAPALGDTSITGEIAGGRKALATNTAGSANLYTAVATWGGAADSVKSIAITEAGITNHASSGQGTLFQRVQFASVTLADSDLLKLTLQTNVGSS